MLEYYVQSKRPAECPICKARGIKKVFHTGDEVFVLPEPSNTANGGVVRVCSNHGILYPYHNGYVKNMTKIAFATGKRHEGKVQYGFEVECINPYNYPVTLHGIQIESFQEACAYLEYIWGGYACYDGSVSAEIVVPAIRNLNGTRYLWANTAAVVDLVDDDAGHHINMSVQNGSNAFEDTAKAIKVLNLVGKIAVENGNVKEVFGRDFTYFAKYYEDVTGKTHNDYPFAWVRPNGVVEFRLAKFKSVNQYMRTCWFMDEMVKLILSDDDDEKSLERKLRNRYIKAVRHETPADKRANLKDGKKEEK